MGRNDAHVVDRGTLEPGEGGAMLGVSRTVNKKGKTVAFEYLRIVERDGGLVYVAQPAAGPRPSSCSPS